MINQLSKHIYQQFRSGKFRLTIKHADRPLVEQLIDEEFLKDEIGLTIISSYVNDEFFGLLLTDLRYPKYNSKLNKNKYDKIIK